MISLKDVSESYDFYTGVPDSGLKSFIREIEDSGFKHIPAVNEGQAIGIAVGAELAGMKKSMEVDVLDENGNITKAPINMGSIGTKAFEKNMMQR